MNIYKKWTTKPYSFLVIDCTLASDNSSRFGTMFHQQYKNRLQQLMIRLKMKNKMLYGNNRQAAKLLPLSSRKTDKYKYLIDEEIFHFDQIQNIKIAKFTYFPLGKPFEKQIKTIKIQGKKHITAIEKRKKQVFKSNAIKYHEYDIEW